MLRNAWVHAWDQKGPPNKKRSERVLVRDLRDGEEPQVLALWRELMDLHVDLDPRFALSDDADQAFMSYLGTARSREDYRVRVAVRGGEVLGFVVACVLPNSPVYRTRFIGYINDICVASSERKKGIGRRLVEDARNWLIRAGATSLEVYVSSLNPDAQRFWREVGARDYLDRMTVPLPPRYSDDD